MAVPGIDIGTTNTKAALVGDDAAGPTVVAVRPTPPSGAALLGTVAEVVRAVLRDGTAPAAIGIRTCTSEDTH